MEGNQSTPQRRVGDASNQANDALSTLRAMTSLSAPPPPLRPIPVTQEAVQQGLEYIQTGPQQSPTLRHRTDVLGSKKRTRMETPSQLVNDLAEEITKTPRTTRIRSLFPTSGADASLTEMIDKLLEVAMASIILGKQTKKVQVDVNSAADLLVLVGEVHDRHQLESTKRSIFQPGRQTVSANNLPPPPT